MAVADRNSLLVMVRHAPYGSSLARVSLEVALAAAAFEQPVQILFLGDGVLQLLPAQDTQALGVKNLGRLLASLPLYDIETLYVDAEAAERYNIDLANTPVPARALNGPDIRRLMTGCDHLLGF